jgi:putative ABC transport system permease protein
MRSLWLQVAAVTSINLKSIAQRRWLSLSTVIAIALVVIVLLAFLAMANGFQRTIAGAGADDIAIVLRAGSQAEINSTVSRDQVRLIEDGPGIARGSDGKPLISPELYLVVDGIKRSTKTKANLPLRGIGEQGSALRKGITITAGRMFSRGSNEVVVGKALQRQFEDSTSALPCRSAPRAGTSSACSTRAAACSNPKSGPISTWCRACSTATTSCRPCARASPGRPR